MQRFFCQRLSQMPLKGVSAHKNIRPAIVVVIEKPGRESERGILIQACLVSDIFKLMDILLYPFVFQQYFMTVKDRT